MAQVGLNDAARLTGKDRSTITRARRRGQLSAVMGGNGRTRYDTAELDRVFGLLPEDETVQDHQKPTKFNITPHAERRVLAQEVVSLKREISRLEDALQDARQDRDNWREALDHSREDAEDWKRQAQALLTSSSPITPAQPEARLGFWRRVFGG